MCELSSWNVFRTISNVPKGGSCIFSCRWRWQKLYRACQHGDIWKPAAAVSTKWNYAPTSVNSRFIGRNCLALDSVPGKSLVVRRVGQCLLSPPHLHFWFWKVNEQWKLLWLIKASWARERESSLRGKRIIRRVEVLRRFVAEILHRGWCEVWTSWREMGCPEFMTWTRSELHRFRNNPISSPVIPYQPKNCPS